MNEANQISGNRPPGELERQSPPAILTVVLLYAVFASLWILLSDKAVEWLFRSPAQVILASTLKGWFFVAVTALLLYGLLQRLLGPRGAPATPEEVRRSLTLPLVLTALAIIALTAGGIYHAIIHHQDKQAARLQAIADLKTRQIADWLKERQGDAEFVLTSRSWAENYHRWRDRGEVASRDRLLSRLEEYRKYNAFQSVLLLDEQGKCLWCSEGEPPEIDSLLSAIARQASALGRIIRLGPYRDGAGRLHLDYAAPLPALNGRPSPVVVLHLDPQSHLVPILQNWPVPSTSSETLLFRRDGDKILFLNELRHQAAAPLKLRLPLEEKNLLAARLLRGEIKLGHPAKGVDYRGVPVLGVIRAVPGTNWFLVAKLDRAEVYSEATGDALWIALAGLLALFVAAAGAFLYRQRQELAFSQREHRVQAEKLRALQLLEVIADGSTDAIFVKDAEGRYLLFNREAARVTGRAPEQVLGRDDRTIFPPDQAELIRANDQRVMADDRVVTFQEDLNTIDGEASFWATKGPIHDADARVVGIFGISRDITDLQRATKNLQENEEKYRLLAENVSDVIWVLDLVKERFRYVSPSVERMGGYTSEEMLSLELPTILTPESLQKFQRVLPERIQRFQEGYVEFFTDEIEQLHQDGTRILAEVNTRLVRNPTSGHLELVGVTRDITERKKSEQALREKDELLREMSAMAHIGGWSFNPITGDGTWTDETARIHDLEPPQEISVPFGLDFFHGEWRRELEKAVREAGENGRPFDLELEMVTAKGMRKWVRILGYPIRLDGRVIRVRGTIQDVTERKRAERERDLTIDLLRLINESPNQEKMIRRAAIFFQEQSGFEAVGIRLQEEDDYPYFEARGFPAEFVLAENSLCARNGTGEVLRDGAGQPLLDCMCGNVIRGRFDPTQVFFTEKGSFWSNGTTRLLATTTEADRQARTRNRCNGEGYESVGLFALRVGEECLGLLQLNDRRPGRFLPEELALWERLAGYLAVALAKFQVEVRLRRSEELYRSLFENMLNGFAYCRMLFEGDQPRDFIYLAVNEAFSTLTGLQDVVGKKVTKVIPGIRETDPELFAIYGRVARSGRPERFELYLEALRMWFSISVYSPKEEHFVAVFDVITERKQAELALRNSLTEKTALLQEVHHRVKNNLQIVASLLSLQARRTSQPEVLEALLDMDHRVRSMALLHETLYRSPDLARINLTVYVEDICRHLLRSYSPAAGRIRIENRIPSLGLSLEQSLPCGLIINELVSNALKHAFPGDRSGRVVIELLPAEGQNLILRISDDGRGLPAGFDLQDTSTLGLQLVSTLAGQMGGRLSLEQPEPGGAVFIIDFPFNGNHLTEGVS